MFAAQHPVKRCGAHLTRSAFAGKIKTDQLKRYNFHASFIPVRRILVNLNEDCVITTVCRLGMKPGNRLFVAWIACFSVLLAALAPAVTSMVAAGVGEISCHTISSLDAGTVLESADDHPSHHSSAGQHEKKQTVRCPFCYTHAGSFGLLPVTASLVVAAAAAAMCRAPSYRSPLLRSAWSCVQPRAPPASA